MEITFDSFKSSVMNQNRIKNLLIHANDKDSPWHKIAASTHISRKRFVKLLMAIGFDRDDANAYAMPLIQFRSYSYTDALNAIRDTLVWILSDGDNNPEYKMSDRKLKSEYEKLVKISEKYPDIVDLASCEKEIDKDENRPGKVVGDLIKLHNYLFFLYAR